MSKEWFAEWFDSSYYPILYHQRNDQEAQAFIDAMLAFVQLPPAAKVLDLACGRGRHSRQLCEAGLDVTGVDLSPASIADAAESITENHCDHLRFWVHDMRQGFPVVKQAAIFNLFTSFGYFNDQSVNLQVLHNCYEALDEAGILVIDYFNTDFVIANLVATHSLAIQDIEFRIHKKVENGLIVKDIHIEDGTQTFDFQERVQAIRHHDFERMLIRAGFEVFATWGNYTGVAFDLETSARAIVFARKMKP